MEWVQDKEIEKVQNEESDQVGTGGKEKRME